MHSEMGETKPNSEKLSSMCAYDCTTSVHSTAQNSSDNLASYLQTTIIALTLFALIF